MAQTVADDVGIDWAYVEAQHEREGFTLTPQDRSEIRRWWGVFERMTSFPEYRRELLFRNFIYGRLQGLTARRQGTLASDDTKLSQHDRPSW